MQDIFIVLTIAVISPIFSLMLKKRGEILKQKVIDKFTAGNIYIYIAGVLIVINAVSHANLINELNKYD